MADKEKMLKRVKALIARTTSDAEEEARTSAMLACKLIREHEFEVVDPQAGRRTSPGVHVETTYRDPTYKHKQPDPFSVSLEDLLRDIAGAYSPDSSPDSFQDTYLKRVEQERQRQAAAKRKASAAAEARSKEEGRVRRDRHEREIKARQEKYEKARKKQEERNEEALKKKREKERDLLNKNTVEPIENDHSVLCGKPKKEACQEFDPASFDVDDPWSSAPSYYATPGVDPEVEPEEVFCKKNVWGKVYCSSYEGKCPKCSSRFYIGDVVVWVRGIGTFHKECWKDTEDSKPLKVTDMQKALSGVKKEKRNSAWQKLKDALP